MPAYLGGTVWVQVVPSFNGLQGSIRKGVGDAFAGAGIEKASADAFKGVDKSAAAAGERSAKAFANSFQKLTSDRIKRVGKDFDALRHDTSLVGKEFAQIRAVLNDIAKHDLTTVTGQGQATQDIVALRRQLQGMLDDADRGQRQLSDPARWGLGAIRGQFDEIDKTIKGWSNPDPIKLKIDQQGIRSTMQAIRDEIRVLSSDVQVGADTSEATAKIASLRARLNQLDRDRVNVDVEVDTLGAMLQLRRLESQISSTGRSGGGNLMALLDAGSAANSVRVFNGVLLTTLTLGPLLIPVLAAITGGILGLGAAALGAGLGIGALVAGLAGIGGAVGAMSALDRAQREQRGGAGAGRDAAAARRQAVQDARAVADAQQALSRARRDGARAIADANRQVIDAEQDLTRAHEDAAEAAQDAAERVASAREAASRAAQDAARAAQDAARRVRDAEQGLVDAQRNAVEVQEDLNAARRQAVRDLQDLKNELDSAKLNEQDLAFQVEEANVHLNVVLEDDQATQRERDKAQLRYDQAVEALEQQQLETKRLTVDQKEAAAAGVEGSDRVKDAKERISDANDRLQSAEEALADARAAQDRQAVDNAIALRDARDAVTDALRDQTRVAQDSAERINDAEQALADARVGRNDAQIAAAQSIADAEQGLARAHEDIALRSAEAAAGTDSMATAQNNLAEALRNLSPAGVAFATWLYSLSPLLRDLRFAAQEGLLPGLQEGLSAIVDEYGPSFVAFVGELAGVLGDLSSEFGTMLTEDETWREFFSMMNDLGPVFLRQFGDVSINLMTAFASIMTAFAPFIAEMGDGLVELTKDFADWAASLEGSQALEDFFGYLRDAGPEIGVLIGNVAEILKDLFIGLAPYADDLLDSLIGLTDWLADMDPDEIARLALGIGALLLSVQLLAGALSLIGGVGGLIGGALNVGKAVGGLGGGAAGVGGKAAGKGAATAAGPAAAAALDGVGVAGQTAGKRLVGLLGPVGLVVGALWLIYDAAIWLDEEFNIFGGNMVAFGDTVGGVFTWWWEEIISPVWDLIKGVLDVMGQAFTKLGDMIGQIFRYVIGPAIEWLWEHTLGPFWDKHVKPMLTAFGNFVKENLPKAIQAGADLIGDIWQNVLNLLRAPIKAAVDIVFNQGIIGSFNWLADKVPGMTPIDPIKIPSALYPNGRSGNIGSTGGGYRAMAEGGSEVLPGYTPGRDVHRFFSPTAGVLDLSGGEGIAVPEIVRAVGANRFQAANKAARAGNIGLAQRYLGGFAGGGIIGDLWDKVKGLGGALGNPLGFFKDVVDNSLSGWGVGGMFGDIIGPMAKSIPASIAKWIADLITPDAPSGGGGGSPAGAMGWQAMWSVVKSQFPNATLNSAYRPGAITAVGTPSYHGQGRAIDITPSMDIFNWLVKTFSNATELIFSPAGGRQLWNGNPYLFGEPTRGDHWDHIHWAMANGGIIPGLYDGGGDLSPGMTLAANKSGKVESIVTDSFMAEVRALGRAARGGDAPVVDARGSNFYDATPEQIVDEWSQRRHDQLALSGIFDEPGVS